MAIDQKKSSGVSGVMMMAPAAMSSMEQYSKPANAASERFSNSRNDTR